MIRIHLIENIVNIEAKRLIDKLAKKRLYPSLDSVKEETLRRLSECN